MYREYVYDYHGTDERVGRLLAAAVAKYMPPIMKTYEAYKEA